MLDVLGFFGRVGNTSGPDFASCTNRKFSTVAHSERNFVAISGSSDKTYANELKAGA
jgi:hypothetical protein